jgi:hypothetical protein
MKHLAPLRELRLSVMSLGVPLAKAQSPQRTTENQIGTTLAFLASLREAVLTLPGLATRLRRRYSLIT